MTLNLAMSYCEMFMNTGDMAQYEKVWTSAGDRP